MKVILESDFFRKECEMTIVPRVGEEILIKNEDTEIIEIYNIINVSYYIENKKILDIHINLSFKDNMQEVNDKNIVNKKESLSSLGFFSKKN